MSLVDVVNEQDEVIGQAEEKAAAEKGLITRNVIVFIQDSDGKYIICKRAPHKRIDPNKFDASVCGNVDAGNTPDEQADIELKQELGITCKLTFLRKIYQEFMHGEQLIRHFTSIYYGQSSEPISLNHELTAFERKSHAELSQSMKEHPERYCAAFIHEFSMVADQLPR